MILMARRYERIFSEGFSSISENKRNYILFSDDQSKFISKNLRSEYLSF